VFRHALMAAALTVATASTALASSWITQDVNLRNGPSTDHHVRAVLTVCTRVDVHERHGRWLRVDSHDGHGWVRAAYVSDHRPRGCGRHDDHVTYYHERPRVQIIIGGGHWYWHDRWDDHWPGHIPGHVIVRPRHPYPSPSWQDDW